jgi:hypothetical protein
VRSETTRTDGSTRTLVLSSVGALTLAFSAHRVEAILDGDGAPDPDAYRIDLGAFLGLGAGGAGLERRLGLVVRVDGRKAMLMVGQAVSFWEGNETRLLALPPLVESALARLGVDGLLALDSGFAYLMDSHWVARQEGPPRDQP